MLGGSLSDEGSSDKGNPHWYAQHVEALDALLNELPPACRKLLHVLARNANNVGVVAIGRIEGARAAGLNPRSWQRALRQLEDVGALTVRRGTGRGKSVHQIARKPPAKLLRLPHRCGEPVDNQETETSPETAREPSVSSGETSPLEVESKSLLKLWLESPAGRGTARAHVQSVPDLVKDKSGAGGILAVGAEEEPDSGEEEGAEFAQTLQLLLAEGVWLNVARDLARKTTLAYVKYAIGWFRSWERDGLLKKPVGALVTRAIRTQWNIAGGPPPGPNSGHPT